MLLVLLPISSSFRSGQLRTFVSLVSLFTCKTFPPSLEHVNSSDRGRALVLADPSH